MNKKLEAEIIKEFKIKFLGLQDYEGRFLIESKKEVDDWLSKKLTESAKAAVEAVKVDKCEIYPGCEVLNYFNKAVEEHQRKAKHYFNNK